MTTLAAIYARVSTDEQAEHGYSRESQIEACRKYAADNGLTVAAEFREDCSGAKLDRPELDALREMIKRREVEAVIIYAADRLSRNLAHSLIIREEWQKGGIELHTVSRGKSEDTAEGRLMENVEAVIAEYEREKIRERTRRGRRAKAESGRWVGGGRAPYGYRKIGKGRDTHLEIDKFEANIVRRVFEMFLGNLDRPPMTLRAICVALQAENVPRPFRGAIWRIGTVSLILTQRAYIGEFVYGGHVVHIPELALIDLAAHDAARLRLERNKELAKRNRKREYLMVGHLRCTCGAAMLGWATTPNDKTYVYYRCRSNSEINTRACGELNLRAEVVDRAIWEWIDGLIRDDDKLVEGVKLMHQQQAEQLGGRRARLATIDEMTEKAERKIKRLASAFAEAEDDLTADALKAQMKLSGKERDSLTATRDTLLAELTGMDLTPAKEEQLRVLVRKIRGRLDFADFEQKRELMDLIDLRARLERDEAGLRWIHITCGLVLETGRLSVESSAVKRGRAGRSRPGR